MKGLDYNTQRQPLLMPEYGREIQKMVDLAVTLPTKHERMACAQAIVRMMITKVPQLRDNANYEQTLWDHLYLMSRKQLDIDWPYDVSAAEKIYSKPAPLPLPSRRRPIRMRHYGRLVEDSLNKLKDMPDGPERHDLARLVATQMRRDLGNWGHGSMDDERVVADIAYYTDGRVLVDPADLPYRRAPMAQQEVYRKKKRK